MGPGQPFMVWVWISKISPKKVKFFNFLPFGSKKLLRVGSESTRVEAGSASYLLRVKSKLGSGQGPSIIVIFRYFYSKYQLSSFNVGVAIKERGQKSAVINKILAIFNHISVTNIQKSGCNFFGLNLGSLYA